MGSGERNNYQSFHAVRSMITFREGEQILATHRRHMIVLLLEIIPLIFFLCVISAVVAFAVSQIPDVFTPLIPLIFLGVLLFANIFWIALFVVLTDFYLDIWIVTDKRVIAIEQKGFFSRTVSEFELAKIQDITVTVHGIIPTLLRYGDLTVRTASEHENFVFKQVPRPNAVKDELLKAALAHQPEEKPTITMQSLL